MKRFLRLLAVVLLATALVTAQTATVKRNVVLRSKASSSSNRITTLKPPATLTLINPKAKAGFLHVTTEGGDTGWVFANNVEVHDEGDTNENSGDNDLVKKLLAAHTDAVGQPLVESGSTVCGPTGDAKDDARKGLNMNKNRTDIPSDGAYVPIDWAALRDLPADRSADLPGAPVTVEGFLVHQIKVESGGSGESTNCHLTTPDEVDWHIYVTDTANLDDISQAVIVETTPRTRPLHKWVKSDLDNVVNKNIRVRISGWLIYDFEHVSAIGSQRASVWEVHPITKIEVQRNGHFVDLEQ
jgi:hypothetical protein